MSEIKVTVEDIEDAIIGHLVSSSYRAANELKSASMEVLRGQRHGERYNIPGTGKMRYYKRTKTAKITHKQYTASAPGEAPAVRTGAFRLAWMPKTESKNGGRVVISKIENSTKVPSGRLLGEMLEKGTNRMAARPYKERVLSKALPNIKRIYKNFNR